MKPKEDIKIQNIYYVIKTLTINKKQKLKYGISQTITINKKK